jgi:hypothetical protein
MAVGTYVQKAIATAWTQCGTVAGPMTIQVTPGAIVAFADSLPSAASQEGFTPVDPFYYPGASKVWVMAVGGEYKDAACVFSV